MDAMRWVLTSAALCTGLLAGCDSAKAPVEETTAAAPAGTAAVPAGPALPTPQLSSTATKSKDNIPPVQGQVDSRAPAQRRDFETKR